MTQPGKGGGWAARGRHQPQVKPWPCSSSSLAPPSPLPRPQRCPHLSCRFQALLRASMWDMDGEDFSEPERGGKGSLSGH